MTNILLTGAGFSFNWDGWLADHVFDYLLSPTIGLSEAVRQRLWRNQQAKLGFEGALAELQLEYRHRQDVESKAELDSLEKAVEAMFDAMNDGLNQATFEPQQDIRYLVRTFLARFDAIFTLNQDLLLEYHYLGGNILLSQSRKWDGWVRPGFQSLELMAGRPIPRVSPDPALFQHPPRLQPYYKLHGSSDWVSSDGQRLMIMGGNKTATIGLHPVLEWYQRQFRDYLLQPNVRLMVIGYSFADPHINDVIVEAADRESLKLFIVDPRGPGVIDRRNPNAQIPQPPEVLFEKLEPRIAGGSRAGLKAIFGSNRVEHAKLDRFLLGM